MEDKLGYFRGWKAACYDVADLLDHLAETAPDEVKHFASAYAEIAKGVRVKGDTALAMAESCLEQSQ